MALSVMLLRLQEGLLEQAYTIVAKRFLQCKPKPTGGSADTAEQCRCDGPGTHITLKVLGVVEGVEALARHTISTHQEFDIIPLQVTCSEEALSDTNPSLHKMHITLLLQPGWSNPQKQKSSDCMTSHANALV